VLIDHFGGVALKGDLVGHFISIFSDLERVLFSIFIGKMLATPGWILHLDIIPKNLVHSLVLQHNQPQL